MGIWTKRTAWEALASAIVSSLLSLIVFTPVLGRLATGWSPGDMLSTYVNAEMWQGFSYRVTDQMGFPLGMDLNAFPGIDITENLFAQLVTNLTGQPFIGINLLIIVSFPIVAALAYVAIRLTGLDGPLAMAFAVAFSLIPYHWGRALGHVYLSTLYSAVTGMILVLLIGSGWLPALVARGPRKRKLLVITALGVLALVTAWTGVYYAAFTLLLGVVALAWRFTRGDPWRALAVSAVPLIAIAGFAVLGFIPALLARSGLPPLAPLGDRLPYHSVMFAGLLVAAILPAPVSALPFLSIYNREIIGALSAAPQYENVMPTSFGTWVTTAALVVFVTALALRARHGVAPSSRDGVTPGLIGTLIGATVLLYVPWGLNYLIAGTVTAQIRAWDRLLPYLLLLFLLGAATVLRGSRIARNDHWALTCTGVIIIVTAVESVLPFRASYAETTATYGRTTQAARSYAQQVNAALPPACGILQLPYFNYPEHGIEEGRMHDYDHFWVSLTNPQKRWSYGAVKNTAASVWAAQLPQTPTPEDLHSLAAAGFCAIHVDLEGYDAEARNLVVWDLTKRLGRPIVDDATGRWLLFGIPDAKPVTQEATWSADLVRFFHPPFIGTDETSMSVRYSELNETWRWLTHPSSIVTFTPSDARVPLTGLTGSIQSTDCYDTDVTLTLTADGTSQSRRFTLPRGGSPQPFAFTLARGTTAPAELTIDAPGEGCLIIGDPARKYAKVLDLTPTTSAST